MSRLCASLVRLGGGEELPPSPLSEGLGGSPGLSFTVLDRRGDGLGGAGRAGFCLEGEVWSSSDFACEPLSPTRAVSSSASQDASIEMILATAGSGGGGEEAGEPPSLTSTNKSEQ
jgi:hypothetical protein